MTGVVEIISMVGNNLAEFLIMQKACRTYHRIVML